MWFPFFSLLLICFILFHRRNNEGAHLGARSRGDPKCARLMLLVRGFLGADGRPVPRVRAKGRTVKVIKRKKRLRHSDPASRIARNMYYLAAYLLNG